MNASITYTYADMESAMCAWEYVQDALRASHDNVWWTYAHRYGMAALRLRVLDFAKAIDMAHAHAVAIDGYDEPFDWEFVPVWMAEHAAEILE